MPLTADERAKVTELAKAQGLDPAELAAAVEALADAPTKPTPGKNDPAAASGADPAGPESGAKAHAGRGYFAYEYPFLTVNEVRASLFLGTAPDGELFTSEWLAKHGGSSGSSGSSTPPAA